MSEKSETWIEYDSELKRWFVCARIEAEDDLEPYEFRTKHGYKSEDSAELFCSEEIEPFLKMFFSKMRPAIQKEGN